MDITPRVPVRWRSIERQLPLLISALVLATVAAFAWTAYISAERIVISEAGARITTSAKTIANLLVQSQVQSRERSRLVASDTAIQRYMISGGDPLRARRALATLLPATATSGAGAQIRRVTGEIALDTSKGRPPPDEWLRHEVDARPARAAVSPMLAAGDSL